MPLSAKYILLFRLVTAFWGLLAIFHLFYLLFFFLSFFFLVFLLLLLLSLCVVDEDSPLLMINLFWRANSEKEGWTDISQAVNFN